MNLFPGKDERKRIILVLSGISFVFMMLLLGKVIGDGCLVPLIFITGCVILALFTANYFAGRKKVKDKNRHL